MRPILYNVVRRYESPEHLLGYIFFPKFTLLSGSSRTRFAVAAKIALHSAGANGGTPGSPTPAGGASLSTIYTLVC